MNRFINLYSVYDKRTGEPLCIDATAYACQIYMMNYRKKSHAPTDRERLSKQFFQAMNKSKVRNSKFWEFYKTDLDRESEEDIEYLYSRNQDCMKVYNEWLKNAVREQQRALEHGGKQNEN